MRKKLILLFLILSFSAAAQIQHPALLPLNNNNIFMKNQFIFSSAFSQNQNFYSSLFLNTITYKPSFSALKFDITLAAQNNNFSRVINPLTSFSLNYTPDNTFKINLRYSPKPLMTPFYTLPQWDINLTKTFFNSKVFIQIRYVH